MKKIADEKHNNYKTFLKRLSIVTIALIVFASSSLQAHAYYEKDPELEYLRTGKELLAKMDELYSETVFDSALVPSGILEPFSVEKTVTAFNGHQNFNGNEFSRKILLLVKSAAPYYVRSIPTNYWVNKENKIVLLKVSLALGFAQQEKEADLAASKIAEDIKSRTDDPRKMIELVNQYLVDNVEYPKKVDYDDEILWNAYGALVEGRAICEGYSLAFTKILRLLDIPVINVLGTANGEGHMWNQVLLDGQWLHVDVTFNDPVITGRKPSASTMKQYHKKHLLLTDKEFKRLGSHKEHPDMAKEEVQDLFYRNTVEHFAEFLKERELFIGDDRGFRLDDSLTRVEMAVMLTRLSGGLDAVGENPDYYRNICDLAFSDVPAWAAPYVGYCYENKLVVGTGKGLFGSAKLTSKLDYSSVLLRAAGIHEGYTYQTSDVKAVEQGFLSKARAAFPDLSRGDVVSMTYNFLSM